MLSQREFKVAKENQVTLLSKGIVFTQTNKDFDKYINFKNIITNLNISPYTKISQVYLVTDRHKFNRYVL